MSTINFPFTENEGLATFDGSLQSGIDQEDYEGILGNLEADGLESLKPSEVNIIKRVIEHQKSFKTAAPSQGEPQPTQDTPHDVTGVNEKGSGSQPGALEGQSEVEQETQKDAAKKEQDTVAERWREGDREWSAWSINPTDKPTLRDALDFIGDMSLDPKAHAEKVWNREVSRTYYSKGKYWYLNDSGRWGEYTKDDLLTILEGTDLFRLNRPADSKAAAVWQREKHKSFTRRILVGNQVEFVGELSGHFQGVSEFNNQKFLIKYGPKIIEPVPGDYHTIQGFLIDLLGEEQLYYLRGWLRAAYTGLRDKDYSTGQMLIISGAKNNGKSFCKENIIRPILGGRHSDPSEHLKGNRFNSDVFESESWEIDDAVGTAEKRKILTGAAKKVTASASHRIEGKNQNGVQPPPMFVRISAYVNDGPDDLFVIPELTDSTRDKLIILHASRPQENPLVQLPDANVEGERPAFKAKFKAELPAFLYSVLNDEIPKKYLHGRFGVAPYVHPVLEEELHKESDEGNLEDIIDRLIFTYWEWTKPWEGSASELANILAKAAKDTNQTRDLDRVKWKTGDAIGKGLSALSKTRGTRFSYRRTGPLRIWRIEPPEGLAERVEEIGGAIENTSEERLLAEYFKSAYPDAKDLHLTEYQILHHGEDRTVPTRVRDIFRSNTRLKRCLRRLSASGGVLKKDGDDYILNTPPSK